MRLARVVGTVVATRKDDALHSHRLLLVQPVDTAGKSVGRPQVSLDAVGAGAGELVFLVRGREASLPFTPPPPTDLVVAGIVDHYQADGTAHAGITKVAS